MEVERKFIVDTKVFEELKLKKNEALAIEQFYLSFQPEIRIRHITNFGTKGIGSTGYSNKYILTIKSEGNKIREELDFQITEDEYRIIKNQTSSKSIFKLRDKYLLGSELVAEVDTYADFDFKTVEVEFKKEEDADTFIPPVWFGKEVTNDTNYKNKNLAKKLGCKFDMVKLMINDNANKLYAVQFTDSNAARDEDYQSVHQTYINVFTIEKDMWEELRKLKSSNIYCNFELYELTKNRYL